MPKLNEGIWLYRNQDQAFEKILKGKTAERKVGLEIVFREIATGFYIQLTDEEGISILYQVACDKQPAQKPEAVNDNIKNQLSKLGNTIYEAIDISIQLDSPWFFPASQLSEWRRLAIEQLDEARKSAYVRAQRIEGKPANYPVKQLTYLGNVTNALAEVFYHEHGVDVVNPGFEVKAEEGVPLMFCKHCIKFTMGWCPKEGYKATFKEPLYLKNNNQLYELTFDCKLCEMRISKSDE
jgi:putative protease